MSNGYSEDKITQGGSEDPVADPGFLEGGFWYTIAREFLETRPTFGQNHAIFDNFWDKLPVQSICFRTNVF